MATATDNTVSTLNTLIETLQDGKKGFESSAGSVKDASLKTTFHQYAQQRARLATELQSEVKKLGGDPETSGSASAAAHRGWINLKTALGGGDKSILDEAERGEDVTVHTYQKAMKETLAPAIAGVVSRQYAEVKAAHDKVKALRDSFKK